MKIVRINQIDVESVSYTHLKSLSIISIAMDAPNNVISALSGKIGMLPGISSKTIYAKTTSAEL